MSNLERIEKEIIELCLDSEGLLHLLRDNKFDDNKYHKLVATLEDYRQAIAGQKFLNRNVAGFLRVIDDVFEGAVIYWDRQTILSEDGRKIQSAHPKILDLMDSIFDVNLEE